MQICNQCVDIDLYVNMHASVSVSYDYTYMCGSAGSPSRQMIGYIVCPVYSFSVSDQITFKVKKIINSDPRAKNTTRSMKKNREYEQNQNHLHNLRKQNAFPKLGKETRKPEELPDACA